MNRRNVFGIVIALVVVTVILSACGGSPAGQPASDEPAEELLALDGETLLKDRCTDCHDLDRTTRAQKTREEWDDTVARMVDKGTKLTDEEQTVLVDYLAATYGP